MDAEASPPPQPQPPAQAKEEAGAQYEMVKKKRSKLTNVPFQSNAPPGGVPAKALQVRPACMLAPAAALLSAASATAPSKLAACPKEGRSTQFCARAACSALTSVLPAHSASRHTQELRTRCSAGAVH